MTMTQHSFPLFYSGKSEVTSPDGYGHWVDDSNGNIALPLYEGRMIGPFDPSEKGWVSGKGRSAVWRRYSNGKESF